MAKTLSFTNQAIRDFVPSRDRTYVRDTKTRGLVLVVHPSGKKVFQLYRRIAGRPERILVGRFPEMALAEARARVNDMNAAIERGDNPADALRDRKGEQTFGEFFHNDYIGKYAQPRKRTWQDDVAQFNRYLKDWADKALNSIRPLDVIQLHNKLGRAHPYSANRLLALVRCVFNRANEWGRPLENPARKIPRFREQSRERFLQPAEMGPFMAAVLAHPNETIRDFVLLALFTGARRSNVTAMRWAEIDFTRGTWTIPQTKSGSPVTVSLTTQAKRVLAARRSRVPQECQWVFPGNGATGHLTEPKAGWKQILTRAGLSDFRLHDIRRTSGAWQAKTGASLPIIGKSLGHKTATATMIYARLDADPVRDSLETAQRAMLAAAEAPTVKPLKARRRG